MFLVINFALYLLACRAVGWVAVGRVEGEEGAAVGDPALKQEHTLFNDLRREFTKRIKGTVGL